MKLIIYYVYVYVFVYQEQLLFLPRKVITPLIQGWIITIGVVQIGYMIGTRKWELYLMKYTHGSPQRRTGERPVVVVPRPINIGVMVRIAKLIDKSIVYLQVRISKHSILKECWGN